MIGYIYQIVNTENQKRYIGKTNDIKKRLERHYIELKNNKHHSHKLQRAFNKYGKECFKVIYDTFINITEEDLAQKEIEYIKKYDSYYNGYNETLGGEGHSLLFDFDTAVLIYQIGQRYDGVKRLLGRYFNCDHSTIADIMNRESLSMVAYDQEQLQKLIHSANITEDLLKENYKNNYARKFSEEQIFKILAGIELKGYSQAACGRVYQVNKDIVQNIIRGKTYKKDKEKYQHLSLQDKQKFLQQLEKDDINHELKNSKKISQIKIDQNIVDFILNNKDEMTQIAIAQELGIDRKRVSRIIKKETYKDLVEDWEKRHSY